MTAIDLGEKSIALVVDDNPDSLGMVASALEKEGMTVLVARDGHSAILLTERVQPDVILMDAVMPDLDGFETCRLLKSGPNPTHAPIVFMTGLTEPEHVVKGLQSGGVDYITKPVEIDEMVARLTTHILNSRLLQSARHAIDAFEQSVLAFDDKADISWASHNAKKDHATNPIDLGSLNVKSWVRRCMDQPVSNMYPCALESGFVLQFIGFSAAREVIAKLVRQTEDNNEGILRQAFELTQREAEVLYWLTLGKTNRDISTILSLSARTVNKHLEQVFQKMGVDNRTSAAVLADRKLTLRD